MGNLFFSVQDASWQSLRAIRQQQRVGSDEGLLVYAADEHSLDWNFGCDCLALK